MNLPKPYFQDEWSTIYYVDAWEILLRMFDRSVDFVFTDPLYGHGNNDGDLIHNREKALGAKPSPCSTARPIANDKEEAGPLFRFALVEFNRLLSPGCCCCCCGGGGPDPQFARWSLWLDEAIGFKQMVVWDKGPIGMGWHYRRSYECVLVGEKPGAKCRWFDETNCIENIIRLTPKIIPQADDHPTVKPSSLAGHFIQLHTRPGHLVLDPFMGGGSTGRAAKDLRRKFIGVEIEEQYCEAAAKLFSQEALAL